MTCNSFAENYPMSLWEDIFKVHWNYLETEENMQKLEKRKNLEVLLKEFMCIAPQDRKFFLPETKHVLKNSVMQMEDFSAYRASIGFDSISQYANNLLTKPWRKEYKTIKMYSGSYQHEIESNLIGAEEMFKAMGYIKLQNNTLVLKGPICLDQVGNVSRDAMAAYVECQIMKEICLGLIKMKFSASWIDIFNFREKYTGDEAHAVKAIAFLISDRPNKEKLENTYNSTCNTCSVHRHQQTKPQHGYHNSTYNLSCNVHPAHPSNIYTNGQSQQIASQMNYGYPPLPHIPQQQPQLPLLPSAHHPTTIPHSKSLEHYVDHNSISNNYITHNRHSSSFDQSIYDGGRHHQYDAVDANTYQQAMPCSHTSYNVSGNRFPIPVNISNQFSDGQYPNGSACNNGVTYATVSNSMQNHQWHQKPDPNDYPDQYYNYGCTGVGGNYTKRPEDRHCNGSIPYDSIKRNIARVDHLVDLEEHRPQPQQNTYNQSTYSSSNHHANQFIDHDTYDNSNIVNPYQRKPLQPSNISDVHSSSKIQSRHKSDLVTGSTSYAQAVHKLPSSSGTSILPNANNPQRDSYSLNITPVEKSNGHYTPMESATKNHRAVDKYSRNAKLLAEYDELPITNGSRNSRASDFDSFEDGEYSNTENHLPRTQTVNKNHDGVGSFETWHFVYQKLEKQGYNKDLGERGDLSVQGLDLNPPGITGGVNTSDKKLARAQEHVNKTTATAVKSKNLDNRQSHHEHLKENIRNLRDNSANNIVAPPAKFIGDTENINRLSKSAGQTRNENLGKSNKFEDKSKQTGTMKKPSVVAAAKSSKSTRMASNGSDGDASTSIIEWACKFCTFLNPGSVRICKMCAKSKDFSDTTSKATTTRV